MEKQKLSNNQQKIRHIREDGERNHFDFNDINQQDVEIDLNEFLELAEIKKTKCHRTPIFDLILDSQRDKYPSKLNREFIINDGYPFQVKRFYKDSDQLKTNLLRK